ncbi:hypothetical protein EOD42_23210 [Rhodovarius crocodyli]|uniref:Uncharacterized protein n=1 Tax=Rhodovarius crocodyli TaxID=1979269 RepID=A0A437LZG4_9PROT|nr:hypothetical protein [Rhodovarius crocodyli]RVT90713.1 hypothetical protein EOD42_23210 [Rhodovarius crocodyli]
MARDGAGTYTLPQPPFVNGDVISAPAFNSINDDVAAALTGSIAADGQTPVTGNLRMDGYRHTDVGDGSARDHYASLGQVQDGAALWCGTAGGTGDAITLTPTPAAAGVVAGQRFSFITSAANTGAVTVAVSGLTAQALRRYDGSALPAGILWAGNRVQIEAVSATEFRLVEPAWLNGWGLLYSGALSGTAVDVNIPGGVRELRVTVNGARIGAGTVQQLFLRVKINGVWVLGGTGQYFDSRSFNVQLGGINPVPQPLADVSAQGHFLGYVGENDDAMNSETCISNMLNGAAFNEYAMPRTRSLTNGGAAGFGWAQMDAQGQIAIPSGYRIEAIRIANGTGSPRSFTQGTLRVLGLWG